MPNTKARASPKAPKLTRRLRVNHFSTTPPRPSQDTDERGFACPLCVDNFKKFSQLKWHLLSVHPRRERIMELVHERYGISQMDIETVQSEALEAQNPQEIPSTCCELPAEKCQVVVMGTGNTTEASKIPFKLRHKAAASTLNKRDKCEMTCKELRGDSREYPCKQKMTPSEESGLWKSYLSFCLSSPVSTKPGHGNN